jgi:hypothetical protein
MGSNKDATAFRTGKIPAKKQLCPLPHFPFRAITVIIPSSAVEYSTPNPAPVSILMSVSGAIRIFVYFPAVLSQSPRPRE